VFASGIGRSARLNILARGGEPLGIMKDVTTVILDKTGTITQGVPEVIRIQALTMTEPELLQIAASVETRFDHPLSRAIVGYAKHRGLTQFKPVSQAEDLPGCGGTRSRGLIRRPFFRSDARLGLSRGDQWVAGW
jgi:Cu+-exporting ATPase